MAIQIPLLVLVLLGHLAICVGLFNRLHAIPLPRHTGRPLAVVHIVAGVGWPAWVVGELWGHPQWLNQLLSNWTSHWRLLAYATICSGVALRVIVAWVYRNGFHTQVAQLLSNHTQPVDVAARLGSRPVQGWSTRLLACVPANQMFQLHVHVKTIELPRLPRELDGLSITHLSDLHLSGQITRPYFDYVIDQANELSADFVAITGDILERECCYAWLPETIARLHARRGVLFVLGNHDKRLRDVQRLRQSLSELGLFDLGRRSRTVSVGEQTVLLAGNELPWFGPPPPLPSIPATSPALRIVLSHSPDQLAWAKQRGFDLLLAGHTHGGHIRLPWIGPVVCPSRYGVKYAGGLFYEPPTLMHVSRGISGLDPIRINCPPELTKLVLRAEGTGGNGGNGEG